MYGIEVGVFIRYPLPAIDWSGTVLDGTMIRSDLLARLTSCYWTRLNQGSIKSLLHYVSVYLAVICNRCS